MRRDWRSALSGVMKAISACRQWRGLDKCLPCEHKRGIVRFLFAVAMPKASQAYRDARRAEILAAAVTCFALSRRSRRTAHRFTVSLLAAPPPSPAPASTAPPAMPMPVASSATVGNGAVSDDVIGPDRTTTFAFRTSNHLSSRRGTRHNVVRWGVFGVIAPGVEERW
jgi:hypothetical protein